MNDRLRDTPESQHLQPEMLADLLSGEIEADDLRNRVVPHLLARCPVCRKRVEGVRRIQKRFDHWNESVALRESREAPRLLARLLEQPEERRIERLLGDEDFHTWGLAQLLLLESREQVHRDARHALLLAELAVLVADHLPEEPYHPDWLGDLKARAWAALGNARRVAGELTSADLAFQRAQTFLAGSAATGRPRVRAEVLDLLASLRREQGRFEESLAALNEAEALYRKEGDRHRVGRVMLNRGKTLEEQGRLEEVVELLECAPSLLDPENEADLIAYARHNLVCCLVQMGRFEEARKSFQGLPEGYPWPEPHQVRLRWLEGQIAAGLHEWEHAETLFREVRAWFEAHELGFDAALVSLDLGALYAELGRDEDLERLSSEILPLFGGMGLGREASAALLLFRQAWERRSLNAELLQKLRKVVERRRPQGPGASQG